MPSVCCRFLAFPLLLAAFATGSAAAGEFAAGLPRTGARLEAGEPYTILAVGDSVTATGNYHEILASKLAAATGNRKIRAVRRAHPGCSADATVRNYDSDIAPFRPDLLLILYGLNDQACFVEPETYLENCRNLADRAVREFGCDVLILEPPPHPDLTGLAPDAPEPWRTGVFAAALKRGAAPFRTVPVFSVFGRHPDAADFPGLFASLHRLYPAADHIHPNAAGHGKLADAVLDTLRGTVENAPLEFSGRFRWPAAVELRAVNRSGHARAGKLTVFLPAAKRRRIEHAYRLGPGESTVAVIPFPELKTGGQLLNPPWSWYLKRNHLAASVVDFGPDGARVTPVPCPRDPGDAEAPETFTLPRLRNESGRLPLVSGFRARELVYTRYGAVLTGEAVADGDLNEWTNAVWSRIGEPHQARGLSGPADFRKTPDEKRLEFTAMAGKTALHLAFRITGKITPGEKFTLYFDPRPADRLNTVGPYFWLDGQLPADGAVLLRSGETADGRAVIAAARRGNTLELSIPYRWFLRSGYPESGDLGFSAVWFHAPADAPVTRLCWSESGHPWTPKNYGILRRVNSPAEAADLPYRVRIE